MKEAAFITKGSQPINRYFTDHMLSKGCMVTTLFDDSSEADAYYASLADDVKDRFFPICGIPEQSADIVDMIEQAIQQMGGLHYLIHGIDVINEEEQYERNAVQFGISMESLFRDLFLYNRSVGSYMARKKEGRIVFPLLSDVLYYIDCPNSPILNHGKIAMMKTLAKELAPFRIAVNAVTFGYHTAMPSSLNTKEIKHRQEIHALKPYLPQMEEMFPILNLLMQAPAHLISGQNLHVGAGLDTVI